MFSPSRLLLLLPFLALSAAAAPSLNSGLGLNEPALFGKRGGDVYGRNNDGQNCTIYASGGDDTPALEAAFATCKDIVVPVDQNLSIRSKLNATGLVDVHIHFHGNLTLWPDVAYWNEPGNAFNVSFQSNSAFIFLGGNNVLLDGGGTFDGNGQTFYDARVTNTTLKPPFFLVVYESDGLKIDNIHFVQSPRWTTMIHSSKNVVLSHVSMINRSNARAFGRESNRETDGVDIYQSDQIFIHDMYYEAGDDCISLKPNSTNVFVNNLVCDGSHGVSVGSLGEYPGVQDIVENIFINNVTIRNSENGARIKAFGGKKRGYGRVKQVVFSNFWHENNDVAITLDSCYKTTPGNCTLDPSNIEISNIFFTDHHPVPGAHAASGKFGNTVAVLSCSPGKCSGFYVDASDDLDTIPSCGKPLFANHNLNVLGTTGPLFVNGAKLYGAGGVLEDGPTPEGTTCEELGLKPLA